MVKIRYMKLKYKQITKVWNVFSNDFRIPVDSHFDPKILERLRDRRHIVALSEER